MRKTFNPTYLGHKKVGWNEKITKFDLFMVWLIKFRTHKCFLPMPAHLLWMKVLIFQGTAHQTVWKVRVFTLIF